MLGFRDTSSCHIIHSLPWEANGHLAVKLCALKEGIFLKSYS